MNYSDVSIEQLLEGIRDCCRFFTCPNCPLSAYGARSCPMPIIQQTCSVIFERKI